MNGLFSAGVDTGNTSVQAEPVGKPPLSAAFTVSGGNMEMLGYLTRRLRHLHRRGLRDTGSMIEALHADAETAKDGELREFIDTCPGRVFLLIRQVCNDMEGRA